MYVNQSEETSLPQNNFIGYSKRKKGAAVRDAWGGGGLMRYQEVVPFSR